MVIDIVLLAHVLDDARDVRKVAMVDGRKQVVLDLEIESTREQEGPLPAEPSGAAEGVAGLDLMRIEAGVPDIDVVSSEVVHLRADHETERDHHGWNGRKERCIDPGIQQNEGPEVAQCEDQHSADKVVVDATL